MRVYVGVGADHVHAHAHADIDIDAAAAQRNRMHLMHKYNEIKDVCQSMLGALAEARAKCTSDLYSEFGLALDD